MVPLLLVLIPLDQLSFQIGEGANQTITVEIASMKATALGADTGIPAIPDA